MKKACFTNQVKTTFFITLFKTRACILIARPTAFSRLEIAFLKYFQNKRITVRLLISNCFKINKRYSKTILQNAYLINV